MATMKDIARITGFSHGTVSNVLNGKSNVSVEKMEAVMAAAKQIGYNINAQAQLLRSNSNNKVAIVLPQLVSEKYTVLFNSIRNSIEELPGIQYDLYLTDDLPSKEHRVIGQLASGRYQSVITVSCLNDANAYYDKLCVSQDKIIFIYRKIRNSKMYITLDLHQAAFEITKHLIKDRPKMIGLYTEPASIQDSFDFVNEMSASILNILPEVKIKTCYSHYPDEYNTAFDFFLEGECPDVIITQDFEKMKFITQASHFGSNKQCPMIYTLTNSMPPIVNGVRFITMNYSQLGHLAVNISFDNLKGENIMGDRINSIAPIIYMRGESGIKSVKYKGELNFLILPSPSTEALKKLLPDFFNQTGVKVNLIIHSFEEIYDILNNMDKNTFYDLLRMDVAFFPWFAESVLLPLELLKQDITNILKRFGGPQRKRFSRINDIVYAMPFDASVQILFYRKDIFENPITKRRFFESTGKELKVPTNFVEYDRISRFFYVNAEVGNPEKPIGSSMTIGSAGIISSEYLLRYYSEGGRLLNQNGLPKLQPALAEKVLNDYIRESSFTAQINSEWWSDSISLFENGNLAMNISYMNLFNDVAHGSIAMNIGFAPVPGGIPQIGGGVLGVSKYSEKHDLAALFFQWFYSDIIQNNMLILGGNTVMYDLVNTQEIKNQYPWLSMAIHEVSAGVRESITPEGSAFNLRKAENIIGENISNALNGLVSPSEAISIINIKLNELIL